MDNQLTQQAIEVFKSGLKAKAKAMQEYEKNIILYSNQSKLSLKGQMNFPINNFSGFIDQYVARMPKLRFEFRANKRTANAKAEARINAMAKRDSGVQFANYEQKIRHINWFAAMSGRGIANVYSTSDNGYQHNLYAVDPADFVCDPLGKANLENHRLVGEKGIFKTQEELDNGVKDGSYDADMVKQVISFQDEGTFMFGERINDNLDKDTTIMKVLGTTNDLKTMGKVYQFAQIQCEYKGKRYYLLIDLKSGVCIRQEPLKDIFKSELYSYTSFSCKDNPAVFWDTAIGTDVRPICEAEREIINEQMNNYRRRARPMKFFDPEVFPTLPQEYIPDRWIPKSVKSQKGVADGYSSVTDSDITGTSMAMINFLRNLRGTDSGINDGVLGQSDTDTVGVNERNLQMSNTKQTYQNESAKLFTREVGLRYLCGLREHLKGRVPVQIMGKNGLQTEYFLREDANPEYDIEILDDEATKVEDNIALNKKMTALNHPAVVQNANPKKLAEELFKIAGYNNSDIAELLDTQRYDSRDQIENAEQAYNLFIEGKTPKDYPNCNDVFIKRFLELMVDNNTGDKDYPMDQMRAYLDRHATKYAPINMTQKGIDDMTNVMKEQMLMPPQMENAQPAVPEAEVPMEQTTNITPNGQPTI